MKPGLGELLQKLKEIARARGTRNEHQPTEWMWSKSPQYWQGMLFVIAELLMAAVPCVQRIRSASDGEELELRGVALIGPGTDQQDVIAVLRELGLLLHRMVSGETDPRQVFLLDRPGKPGRWSEHRRIAIAYWRERAIDPTKPVSAAVEAARCAQTVGRPRALSAARICKIAQEDRADALEHLVLFAGTDGMPSAEQVQRLVEHLQQKSKEGNWDKPLARAFPELPSPIKEDGQPAVSRTTRPQPITGQPLESTYVEGPRMRKRAHPGRRVAGPRRSRASKAG